MGLQRVRQDWACTHESYCYNLTGESLSQSVRVGLQSQFPPFTLVGPTVTRGESPGGGATRMSVYKADTKCQKYLHHYYNLEKPKVCLVTTLPLASLVKGLQELPAKLHFTYLAHQGDSAHRFVNQFSLFQLPCWLWSQETLTPYDSIEHCLSPSFKWFAAQKWL